MAGPLEGVKIVELAHWAAVPAATAIMSDWGATVVKVEDPRTGDPYRGHVSGHFPFSLPTSPGFEVVNRNKRSVALDLLSDQGKQVLCRLVQGADVFATNLLDAVLDRLGASYSDLSRQNPRLVYLSLTGYGDRGADRERPGYDNTACWARSGIMAAHGEPDAPPVGPRPGMGDRATSMLIVGAVTAALLHREKAGSGQHVRTALVHCGLWQMAADITASDLAHQAVSRSSRRAPRNPLINSYKTQDGSWIQLGMPQADIYWPGFCRALEHSELEGDPRFASLALRQQNAPDLVALLDNIFLTKSREAWIERLQRNGCVAEKIQTTADVLADEQLWQNEFLTKVPHPEVGEITMVTAPGKFSDTPTGVRSTAPSTGQHTEEILLETGYSWQEIALMKDAGIIL